VKSSNFFQFPGQSWVQLLVIQYMQIHISWREE